MAGDVLALIPAKYRSVGVPMKNWRPLCGVAPATRAQQCALAVPEVGLIVVSTEAPEAPWNVPHARLRHLQRPPAFAQDDTPMLAVVQHALEAIPGPSDQIIVLLQPTQPLRQPKHVQAAIQLLRESRHRGETHYANGIVRDQQDPADSVVSVVEVPADLRPDCLMWMDRNGEMMSYMGACAAEFPKWSTVTRRQDATPAWKRDGTVYAFWRRTVTDFGSIYGQDCRGLIIPPEDTCPLDTPEDWAEAERRLATPKPPAAP